jgi:hypothetical protein
LSGVSAQRLIMRKISGSGESKPPRFREFMTIFVEAVALQIRLGMAGPPVKLPIDLIKESPAWHQTVLGRHSMYELGPVNFYSPLTKHLL